MSNIITYLKNNSNLTFDELALNDVDILCLNEFGYISFEKLINTTEIIMSTFKLWLNHIALCSRHNDMIYVS